MENSKSTRINIMRFPKNPIIGELYRPNTSSKYAYQWNGEAWDIVSTLNDSNFTIGPDGMSSGIIKKLVNEVYNEEPVGELNGENKIFILKSSPIEGSEKVYVNGLLQRSGIDYQIINNIIYLEYSLENDERIICSYSELKVIEIFNEIPIGVINGINKIFNVQKIPIESTESLYLNGILLRNGEDADYVINNNIITLHEAPFPGEKIICNYQTFL
jgi:hypothetical protein